MKPSTHLDNVPRRHIKDVDDDDESDEEDKGVDLAEGRKKVRFEDDNGERVDQKRKIKKLEEKVFELELENSKLKRQLKKKDYAQVYEENEALKD